MGEERPRRDHLDCWNECQRRQVQAHLRDLAAARTADVFGRRNTSLIGTLGFDYEGALKR